MRAVAVLLLVLATACAASDPGPGSGGAGAGGTGGIGGSGGTGGSGGSGGTIAPVCDGSLEETFDFDVLTETPVDPGLHETLRLTVSSLGRDGAAHVIELLGDDGVARELWYLESVPEVPVGIGDVVDLEIWRIADLFAQGKAVALRRAGTLLFAAEISVDQRFAPGSPDLEVEAGAESCRFETECDIGHRREVVVRRDDTELGRFGPGVYGNDRPDGHHTFLLDGWVEFEDLGQCTDIPGHTASWAYVFAPAT